MTVFSKQKVAAVMAIVGLLTVSSCSNKDNGATSNNSSKKTSDSLTIWADTVHITALRGVAADFQKETHIKVKLIQKDMSAIEQGLITQVPAGKGPDVAIGPDDWTGLLATDGVIQPIEFGDSKADYEKVAVAAFTYSDKTYGLPYSLENVGLVRNKKLAPNPPASWDDMVSTSKAARTEYPYLIQVGDSGDSYTMYPVQTSFGSFVFPQKDDGSYDLKNPILGDENGKKYASWLREQADAGILSTSMTSDIALSKFEQGASPYMITGPWNIQALKKAGLDVAVDPIPSAGGQTVKPFVGVYGFFLSAKSNNKLAATNFLTNYIGTAKVQESLYKAGGVPPALTKAYEKAGSDPIVQGFEKASKDGVPMPNSSEMSSIWQSWNSTEVSIVNKSGDPSTLWEHMAEDVKSTVAKKS